MAKPFVFKMHWDENIQMLHVSCGDHEMSFSKEYLEDTPSWQLIEMFDKLSSGTKGNWTSQYMNEPPPHKPANFTKHINKPKWEELLLPGIRKYWNGLTGGWAETCTYSYETETYNIVFSQGMCAKLPRQLFDDQQYDYIREILQALAGILQKYNGSLGSFDYKTITGTIYTIELSWQIKTDQQAMAKMLEKNMKFASLYKMSDEGIAKLMEAAMPKALHVYDLGDGMLVPCELAAEIVKWSKQAKPYYGKGIAEQMAATVTIPKKPAQITKESLAHYHKLLGGKKNPF